MVPEADDIDARKRIKLLEARERIMHRYLDKIGAPTHGGIFEGQTDFALNINGRMHDFIHEHPELVKPGLERFEP